MKACLAGIAWRGLNAASRYHLISKLSGCRETRYFSTWKRPRTLETFYLPPGIQAATGQRECPIGDGILVFNDCLLASETCEELFTPAAQNIGLANAGVEVITNGSGSHHQVQQLLLARVHHPV